MNQVVQSGLALIMGQRNTAPSAGAPLGTLKTSDNFWREFARVQSDKILLFLLIIFLHFTHADEKLQATAIGGLIYALQAQRFKLG